MTLGRGERAGPRPRRDSLDLMTEVWSNQRSGQFEARGWSVQVQRGDPVDADGLTRLQDALKRPGLRFSPDDDQPAPAGPGGIRPPAGAKVPLAPVLLAAARQLADPRVASRGLASPVVAGPFHLALSRLPLRPAVRRAVRTALEGQDPLESVLGRLGLQPDAILEDFGALVSLGVLRVSGFPPPRMQLGRKRDLHGGLSVHQRREIGRRRLEARLARDWQALENADAWSVLGIPRGAGRPTQLRAAARMRARYSTLAPELDGPESRAILKKIQGRVEQAIQQLEVPEATPSASEDMLPGPEQSFRMGQQAALRGDFGQARRWFGLAHQQDPDAPEAVAWFGWSIVVDPRISSPSSRRRGEELIDEALAIAPDLPSVLHRALEVALHQDRVDRAQQLLERLHRASPRHPELASLTRRVERMNRPPR